MARRRRLEDQIRELCARAVVTPESAELDEIFRQLRAALHEHTERLRRLATKAPMPTERRSFKPQSLV